MDALLILIPATLVLSLVGLAFFLWQVKNGQYEDPEGSAARAIFDDENDINI
jgi:cbb3-type cytochrome oxidase maturation protein